MKTYSTMIIPIRIGQHHSQTLIFIIDPTETHSTVFRNSKKKGFIPLKLIMSMDKTPVSVELEIRAYNDSTEEIASYLDSSTQLDTLDVTISSIYRFLQFNRL